MPRYGPYRYYNNSITLWFDSDDLGFGKHVYLREYGEELVPQRGVTTILKIIDKSEYLVPWAAKRVCEKLAATFPITTDGFDDYTKPLPVEEFQELLAAAKKAPREILVDAGNVGEEAHQALEDAIKFAIRNTDGRVQKLVTNLKDPRAQSCCDAAMDWMTRHEVDWLSTERKVYSREYEFAGTMDGLAYVSSCDNPVCCRSEFTEKLSVIDWKSSNQLSVSYCYQVAAYWHAYYEETTERPTDAFILRLGKEEGDFEPWHMSEEELGSDFETFALCLDLTINHDDTKNRMSAAKKARTARKKLVKKVETW